MFIKKGMIVLVYVDDCIFISDKKETLLSFINSLKNGTAVFEFTDEGPMDKYLGVEIEKSAATILYCGNLSLFSKY